MPQIDLVTGLPGSGKTTFIHKYARFLIDQGLMVGILENDYGVVNIDMMLLEDLMGDNCDVEMIAGGEGLVSHRRRLYTKLVSMAVTGFDRVIVEAPGICDTEEFFDILAEEPLCRWYSPGSMLAVIDARMEGSLSDETAYLLVSQTDCAGKILLSSCGKDGAQAPEQDGARTLEQNGARAPEQNEARTLEQNGACALEQDGARAPEQDEARTLEQNGACAPEQDGARASDRILGLLNSAAARFESSRRFTHQDILDKDWRDLTAEDLAAAAMSGMFPAGHKKLPPGRETSYGTLCYYGTQMEEEELRKSVVRTLEEAGCGKVMRVKGFARTGEGARILVNATRHAIRIEPAVFAREILLVTGEDLHRDAVDAIWAEASERTAPGRT